MVLIYATARWSEFLLLDYLTIIEQVAHVKLARPLLPQVKHVIVATGRANNAIWSFHTRLMLLLMSIAHDFLNERKVLS